ncbi:unnamed protein product, partial [Allacma fusca]
VAHSSWGSKPYDKYLVPSRINFLVNRMGTLKVNIFKEVQAINKTSAVTLLTSSLLFECLGLRQKIYNDFNVSLEPLFENVLKQLILRIKSENWNVLEILTAKEKGGVNYDPNDQNTGFEEEFFTGLVFIEQEII